jgi:hypothetical protein
VGLALMILVAIVVRAGLVGAPALPIHGLTWSGNALLIRVW